MSATARIAAFAAGLAVVFAGAAVAGNAIDPDPSGGRDPQTRDHALNDDQHSAAGSHGGNTDNREARPVRGLAVADGGLRLVLDDTELRREARERLSFRIVDDRGAAVRDFDLEHEKRMHVIVVRRDLTGFQHLHPEMGSDGTWTTSVRLSEAGSYRVFADFSHQTEARTLGSDLRVDGDADLQDLPQSRPVEQSDGGHDVRLDAGRARAGEERELRFTIRRDGEAVHPEPYLGAGGHLVALREGDLAFLHVHPTDHPDGDGRERDDSVGFAATFPTGGRYRLFLQFKHEGRVRTVAFTQEVSP